VRHDEDGSGRPLGPVQHQTLANGALRNGHEVSARTAPR
jgi:hypothetical protein